MLSQWQVDSFSSTSWTWIRQSLPVGQLTLLLPARGTRRVSCTLGQIPPGRSSPAQVFLLLSPGWTNGRVIARAEQETYAPCTQVRGTRGGKYSGTSVIPAATAAYAAGWADSNGSEKAGRLGARKREGRKRRKWEMSKCHIFFLTLRSCAQISSILPCSHCKEK